MKLFGVLYSVANASHYRGGTYQFKPSPTGMAVTVTQTWRDDFSGYSPRCTQSDVVNQAPSIALETSTCFLHSGESCGEDPMDYTVTFVGDDYCYGDGVHEMIMPSGGFTYGWSSCCWVTLTTDAGNAIPGGNMIQIATVNDLANNSPVFKHPPLWLIMAGCDGHFIDLAPQDIDNDRIACRWATPVEAGGAFTDLSVWPSLSLDAESCTVHYSGSVDGTNVGVKPVSLMIEDFDIDGNVRSSVPVQFLARVWTPNLQSRTISYPDWFATDTDDHHDEYTERETKQAHKKVARVGRSVPAYCNAVPVFIGATPKDGDVLDASSGSLSFTINAHNLNWKMDQLTSFRTKHHSVSFALKHSRSCQRPQHIVTGS